MNSIIIDIFKNEFVQSALILLSSIIFAQVLHMFLTRIVKRIAEKTKNTLDDKLVRVTTVPTYMFIIFIGLYYSLITLSYIDQYRSWVDKVFFVGMVVLVSTIVGRIFTALISHLIKLKRGGEKTPKLIKVLLLTLIYFIALIIILDYFKIEVTPLIATLGIGGVAIGLALQSTLANAFAGFQIISDKIVKVGDFIELDSNKTGLYNDYSGYVEDITWRSTKIRTLANNIVVIPNSKLADNIVVNNSTVPERELSVVIPCGVAYDSNLDKVEKVTVGVAKNIQKTVKGAVKIFEPFIRYSEFGDSNINFFVILKVENFVDKYLVRHEFIKALKKAYDKENIEISWPVRKIYTAK
jgi:small-conductance mechanosensitive channel